MKKIFLFLAVIAVSAVVYFNMRPVEQQYMDDSDVQAYLNLGLEEQQYMDTSDVQGYTPDDVMENGNAPSSKKKRYYAVRNHKPRASTLGFSITPPPGANWYEKLEDNSLYYVKINKLHKQYAILTEAREVQLRETIKNLMDIENYLKREKQRYVTSARIKEPTLTVQVEKSHAQKCVRYSQSYQDHGMKGLRGQRYVNVDTEGLFCLHPENARVAIDLNYVEKSLSDTQVKSYSNEGEQFLASLKFL